MSHAEAHKALSSFSLFILDAREEKEEWEKD